MTNVLLIDEVQMCPQFKPAMTGIYVKRIYDIDITGSDPKLTISRTFYETYDYQGIKIMNTRSVNFI